MEILAVIPARGGSKGILRKNIKILNGKPLIAYTIQAALESKYVTKVVVSTEDLEIAEISKNYGAEVINRPIELAQDDTKTPPVVINALEQLGSCGYKPDIVVLLQATSPMRDAKRLDSTIEYFLDNPKCDSVFCAHKVGITHTLWRQNHDESLLPLFKYHNRPRRQDEKEHYPLLKETGETYIIKTDVLLAVDDIIGNYPRAYIVEPIIDIDTIEDFKKVEELL